MEKTKPDLGQRDLALIIRGVHEMMHVYTVLGMDPSDILSAVHVVVAATDDGLISRSILPQPSEADANDDEVGRLLFAVASEQDPDFPASPEEAEQRIRDDGLDIPLPPKEEAPVPGTGFYL